ncbi:phage terminase large subunit family protein [uncultured Parasutterella sp.]|uniref:phage terminase large subunit family protein n=1 Tax=uncultured Parasutterella sp. TaxID=1263098 RepID=UPI0033902D7D
MSAKSTALPGRYSAAFTPWVHGMHEALDDPNIHRVVALKSAQVGWTDGVILNYLGKRIDIDPCPMIVMFAKEGAARQFSNEKLGPMIEVTPRLLEKIPICLAFCDCYIPKKQTEII